MVNQISRCEESENITFSLDPINQLGRLCGIDGLTADSHGLCSFALGKKHIVHSMTAADGTSILLSSELKASTRSRALAVQPMQPLLNRLRDEGSDFHLGADEVLCLQRTFDTTVATPDGRSNGVALLAEIDLLLAHVADWQESLLRLPVNLGAPRAAVYLG